MGSTIDNRVVEMTFDNKQFESGVKTTIKSLDELNQSLKLDGIADGVSEIASKLTAVGAAGFTAVQEITKGIINAGHNIASAITDPIVRGGKKRALAIEQAKFQFKGLGMNIEKTMDSALTAVKGTAFGLDEAATAAAMFGASGIKAGKEMTSALRGIAGVAAMSGSSYAEIADVFTKVAGQGRLMGDDLNRLASRGINAAATLGKAMGKTESQIREMVTDGKISFKEFSDAMDDAFGKHATKASETFTGALANLRAAFARIGAKYFFYQFEGLRVIFNELTQVVDNIARIIAPLTTKVGEAFLDTAKSIKVFLDRFDALKLIDKKTGKSLDTHKELNALGVIVIGLVRLFDGFISVLRAVGDAFLKAFPRGSKANAFFLDMAEGFAKFAKAIQPSKKVLETITKVFVALFSIGHILRVVIGSLFDVVGSFFDGLSLGLNKTEDFSDSILDMIQSFADWIIELSKGIKSSETFNEIISTMKEGAYELGAFLGELADSIKNLFSGTVLADIKEFFSSFNFTGPKKDVSGLTSNLDQLNDKIKGVRDSFKSFKDNLKISSDTSGLTSIGEKIKTGLSNINWNKVFTLLFTGINTVVIYQVIQTIRRFIDALSSVAEGSVGVLQSLTDVLGSMQNEINSKAIKNIAISVGILVGSLWVLSTIDSAKLLPAMGVLSALIAELAGIVVGFSKIDSSKLVGALSTAAALQAVAQSVLILSLAIAILGRMEPEQLKQGLIAVSVMLGALALFIKLNPEAKLAGVAMGLIGASIAILILSKAVAILGGMDREQLIQGGIAIASLLLFLGLFVKLSDPGQLAGTAAALVAMSGAILALSFSVKMLGGMDLKSLAKGLGSIAFLLLALVLTMKFLPKDSAVQAAALVAIAGAISILVVSLKIIAGMNLKSIIISVITIGVMLALLVGTVALLSKVDSGGVGAASLVAISLALLIMATAIGVVGSMPIEVIGKGLLAFAGILGILAIAVAALMIPGAAIAFMALAVGLLMIAGAVMLAGAGVMLFSMGIMYLASALSTGGVVILEFIQTMIDMLPEMVVGLAKAIGAFFLAMTAELPKIFTFVSVLISMLLLLLVSKIPEIITTMFKLLMAILTAINDWMPQIIKKGAEIIVNFLTGIAKKVPDIADAGTKLIVALIKAIAEESVELADAALEAMVKFLEGLDKALEKNGKRITNAAQNLINEFGYQLGYAAGRMSFAEVGRNIVAGVIAGIKQKTKALPKPMRDLVNRALVEVNTAGGIKSPAKKFMPAGRYFVLGIISGIKQATPVLLESARTIVKSTRDAMMLASDESLNVFNGIEDPVIKPVVDLDNVYKGIDSITAAMSRGTTFAVAADINSRQNGSRIAESSTPKETVQNSEVTFTQINNSPKALSRLEIYRQTQNQILQLKGLGFGR